MKTYVEASIGDFEVLKEIGTDLMGTQYLAQHRYLKRLFILKALPKELAKDPEFIARFEKEIAQSGRLDHPHIVRMHNATFIDKTFYIISEAIDERAGKGSILKHLFIPTPT